MSDVNTTQPTAEFPVQINGKTIMCRDIVDSRGRKLRINKLDLLSEMDLIEAAGPDASGNQRWMMLATLSCCINEINGTPMLFPATRAALRQHIAAVGSEGVAAVAAALRADIPDESAPDTETATAKNLAGTSV